MSDSEDDFMSDKFLQGTEEIRPGLAKTTQERRILKIEAERDEMEAERQRARAKMKPEHRERERREEVLAKPISEESKGFALMAKMGFKPGMSLGKKKDEHDLGSGIREPLNIELRNHRGGLGIDSAERERVAREMGESKHKIEQTMKRMTERSKIADDLADDYRKRARLASTQKQLIGDILRSRQTCHELDLRKERGLPTVSWYWPIYRVRKEEEPSSSRARYQKVDDDDDYLYHYANGREAPKDDRLNEMTDEVLLERLESITAYLRSSHYYCTWCGCAFTDDDDLEQGCPGPSRQMHDDDEE